MIEKNLKMIYYSGLHRQSVQLISQGFAYNAQSRSAEKNYEILVQLTSEKTNMSVLTCWYNFIPSFETECCNTKYLKRQKKFLIFQHPQLLLFFLLCTSEEHY